MTKLSDVVQHQAENPSLIVKVINYVAAILGIGTFLQLVNVVVGLLSAGWLLIQLYGYVRYELPRKRAELRKALRELGEATGPGDL